MRTCAMNRTYRLFSPEYCACVSVHVCVCVEYHAEWTKHFEHEGKSEDIRWWIKRPGIFNFDGVYDWQRWDYFMWIVWQVDVGLWANVIWTKSSVFIEMQFYYLVFIYRNKKKIKAKRTSELVLAESQLY